LAGLGRRISVIGDLRAFLALLRLMFRLRPDIVHTHTAKAGTLGRLAGALYNVTRARRRRAVVVHTFHGNVLDGYFSAPLSAAIRATERTLALLTDVIIAIAPQQRDDLVHRYRISGPSKIRLVRLGLDLSALLSVDERTPTLRGELSIAEDALVVGYVGRLVPIKNVELLLRAFATAFHSNPGAYLVIAGDGPLGDPLARLSRELGVADRVRFLGWRRDLRALYASFDVLALTSRNEGTPVAVIEAMAAARPVVATKVGGVPDVVDAGSGLLVPSDDGESLAGALRELAASGAVRRRMGTAGRQLVATRYSSTRLIEEIDALYRTTLAVKRGVAGSGQAQGAADNHRAGAAQAGHA
jgi:glycosyltransferase involved in cell wall biosynthesis